MKKKLKVFISLLAVLSMTFSTAGHVGIAAVDNGTEIPEANINILYEEESILINESGMSRKDNVIYYVSTYTTDLSKWYQMDVVDNKALFDISWTNMSTNEKLYICGDVNKKVTSVTITARSTFSATFTGSLLTTDVTDAEDWKAEYAHYPNFGEDTGYIIFSVRVNGMPTTYCELDNIEWRKGNEGIWRDYDELDLHEMELRGGTLQFRIKASNADGNRYSTTAKYTVAKLPVNPSVSVTNTTGTISLKNGYEFSTNKRNWTLIPAYSAKGTTNEMFVDETDRGDAIQTITTTQKVSKLSVQQALGKKTSEDISETVLYVRNAGNGRSAAARVTTVRIPATLPKPSNVDSNIKMNYSPSKTGTAGIELVNNYDENVQIVVVSPTEQAKYGIDPSDATTLKDIPVYDLVWTTVRANSSTKVVYKRAPSGSIVLVRKAGTEDNLASPYVILSEKVDYSKAVTYASVSGSPKVNYTLQAIPSTNINKEDPGLTYLWQWADSKTAPDDEWHDIGTGRTLVLDADGSVYPVVKYKYVRVTITFHGRSFTSMPVGTIK